MKDGKVIAAEENCPEENCPPTVKFPLAQLHFAVATEDLLKPQHSLAVTTVDEFFPSNVFSLRQG